MDREFLINLTKELYRLTLLFPKKEPLRYKMREIADDILQKVVSGTDWTKHNPSVLKDIEVLNGFFEVAKTQNWVPAVDILRIQEEYNRIEAEIKKITKQPSKPSEKGIEAVDVRHQHQQTGELVPSTPGVGINERQQKILAVLKEKSRAQVWQVKQVFPEVTKRTLRRDFESLLKKGIIERIGERNTTFYQLKRRLAPLEVGQG